MGDFVIPSLLHFEQIPFLGKGYKTVSVSEISENF